MRARSIDDMENNDNKQLENVSLLESILFLMTPEQREHFLKSSLSNGVIYANKSPAFEYPLSVLLTWTANKRLSELFMGENIGETYPQSQHNLDTSEFIRILKNDLEGGVRLSGAPASWYENNNGKEDIPIHVQSRSFSMQCHKDLNHAC